MLDKRSNARRRKDATESETACADTLDECSLRHQLDLDVTGEHLVLGFGIESDAADDELAHELGGCELADAETRCRGIVRDYDQLALVLTA